MSGSFVFIVAPYLGDDRLFPLESVALHQMAEMLETATLDDDTFSETLTPRPKRTIAHFRDFLSAMEQSEVGSYNDQRFSCGRCNGNLHLSAKGPVEPDRAPIEASLPSERFQVRAHLIAINHERRTFGIKEVAATESRKKPRSFRGSFDSALLPVVDGLAAGPSTAYSITLLKEQEAPKFADANPRSRYRMEEIKAYAETPSLRAPTRPALGSGN